MGREAGARKRLRHAGMSAGGERLAAARQRKRDAVRAVRDALTELCVADRLLHAALGRDEIDDPRGFSTLSYPGSLAAGASNDAPAVFSSDRAPGSPRPGGDGTAGHPTPDDAAEAPAVNPVAGAEGCFDQSGTLIEISATPLLDALRDDRFNDHGRDG